MQRFDISLETTIFPESLYDHVETLEVMNLAGGRLNRLPKDLSRFKKLKVLFASGNPLPQFPEGLEGCEALEMIGLRGCGVERWDAGLLPSKLRALVLTDNALSSVPKDLGAMGSLEKLMLSGNRLTHLPEAWQGLGRLEMLRLASNTFEVLPSWLMELPNLRWLAFGGNPAVPKVISSPLESYPWSSFKVGERLGRGASGEVFAANHPLLGRVALKAYLAEKTSDGSPVSEILAWQQVPTHRGFLPCLAEVTAHPEGKRVMAMPCLPKGSQSVAEPPSLQSCTRDLYARPLELKAETVRAWLGQLAEIGRLLHERSLMHGDFYAHNLHTNPADPKSVTLGDFGAAACYAGMPGVEKFAERVEVLAFATLAEELIRQVVVDEVAQLRDWRSNLEACFNASVKARPSFRELQEIFA